MDECTKAETGVGAAMAAGSQAEKGIWALLVNLPRTIIHLRVPHSGLSLNVKFQLPAQVRRATPATTQTSPTRFLSAVRNAAFEDLALL